MRTKPPFTHGEVEQMVIALTIIRDMAAVESQMTDPDPWKYSKNLEATLREINRRAEEILEMEPSGREGGG